jgi:hypothetical protein
MPAKKPTVREKIRIPGKHIMSTLSTKDELAALKLRIEVETAQHDLESKRTLDQLQAKKLQREIETLTDSINKSRNSKLDNLEEKKREQEIRSLAQSIKANQRFDAIRAWAPALSLFLSVFVGAATLLYQNHKDHEFRVTEEMVKLIGQLHDPNPRAQISAAIGLGLFGKGVEPVLVKEISSTHTEEFYYHAIPDALLRSVQNGNNNQAIVSAILHEITIISGDDPSQSDVEKIKRATNVLKQILGELRETETPQNLVNLQSTVYKSVTSVRTALASVSDKNIKTQIGNILDSMKTSK